MLVEDSDISELKDLLLRRSCKLAEWRDLITQVKGLLLRDDQDDVGLCRALLEKMATARDAEDRIVDDIRGLAISNSLDMTTLDSKEHAINKDSETAEVDAQGWIAATHTARALEESRQRTELLYSSGGARHKIAQRASSSYEEVARDQQLRIEEQNENMRKLEETVQQMQGRLVELSVAKDQIGDLKATLLKQKDSHDKDTEYYQATILKLREDLQAKDENESASASVGDPRVTSTRREDSQGRFSFGDYSRSGVNQDDLLALSQVMQRTNVDLIKSVLDETREQHKKIWTNIQSPRVELREYNGDITLYHAFINRFDDVIGNLDTTYSVKLNSLLQYCGPTVMRHLTACEYQEPREGYMLARKILAEKFGRPHLIVNAWIDKLLAYPKLTKPDQMELFTSDLKSCQQTLLGMNCIGELDNTDRKRVLLSKLPTYIQQRWRKLVREANDKGVTATLEQFIKMVAQATEEQADPIYGAECLAKVVNAYEARSGSKQQNTQKRRSGGSNYSLTAGDVDDDKSGHKGGARPKSVGATAPKGSPKEPCACCGQQHFTRLCDSFKTIPSQEKLRLAREKGMCLLCLSVRHPVDKCFFTWRCQKNDCGGKHNNVLHEAIVKEGTLQNDAAQGDDARTSRHVSKESTGGQKDASPLMHIEGKVVEYGMPVVPVVAKGLKGSFPTCVFADTGGSFSVITKRFKDKLGLIGVDRERFNLSTITGVELLNSVQTVTFPIVGKNEESCHLVFNAVVLDKVILSEKYAECIADYDKWPHLKELNIPLPDVNNIDILIGQDNAHLFKGEKLVESQFMHGPYAARTAIGWAVHGFNLDGSRSVDGVSYRLTPSYDEVPLTPCKEIMASRSLDEQLLSAVDRLVKLEEVPEVIPMSTENKEILELWDKETKLVDGHVQVPLPIKGGVLKLPNNFDGVLSRHRKLGQRLKRNPELHKMFTAAMHENMEAGYTEVVTEPAKIGSEWYIPTQPVLNDKKPGKCRIVGDASYIFQGACLNTAIHQGPNHTANIIDILIKFRRYPVVFTGDVKAMYNQVHVPAEQRDCLRILWWKNDDPDQEVIVLRMRTQMFGGSWSPAASMFAFHWIAKHFSDEYAQETIDTILRHFYVDDLLRSVIDEVMGLRILKEVRHLLSRAHFHLTKIGSNSLAILQSVPVEDRAKSFDEYDLELSDSAVEQTLGSIWKPKQDVLGFKVAEVEKVVYTRRAVLSRMSSLYDPLGLVSPFVLVARILLQDIVKRGYGWDEEFSPELQERWDLWLDGLACITNLSVPRWLGIGDDQDHSYQVHTFMDASEQGYGCVCYLLNKTALGDVTSIKLMAAKAKVSPIKTLTIPRLELSAAVVGVKMTGMLTKYLDMDLDPTVFWSDSTIVLHYVAGQPWQYKTFVANRVVYLQDRTTVDQWRHVSTTNNIADVVSRGLTGKEFTESLVWLEGPQFLKDPAQWTEPFTRKETSEVFDEDQLELKKLCNMKFHMVDMINVKSEDLCRRLLTRFSRWNHLLRAVCYWQRLIGCLLHKTKPKNTWLSSQEVVQAENTVVRLTQQIYVTDNQKKSKYFQKLFVFDKGGILRVGGRLLYSTLTFEEKHPPILPASPVLNVYIYYIHERTGHSGVDRTYFAARQRFWILGGRPVVKKVLSSCVVCKKTRGRFQQQVMAPLPSYRVEEGKVPFQQVGVDYFGPFMVKVGRVLVKRYACMYTDLLMRACHVEVAPDLTASAFINSLQRFISRRGKPTLLVSDNGTNFVGANKELKDAVKQWNVSHVSKYMAEEGITWSFNTPTASHHGGVWERMIRSFRSLALVVMKDQSLTEDSLRTFTCIIEQIMNSRPLTKMTEDPGDPLPITPEHLINLRSARGLPGNYEKSDTIVKRWKQLQYLGDRFWRRWVAEYLRTLQVRVKWSTRFENLRVGDIVLVMHETTPRLKWPLGLVLEVIKGRDGCVRSVRLKTETGIYVRPITKLINLECNQE